VAQRWLRQLRTQQLQVQSCCDLSHYHFHHQVLSGHKQVPALCPGDNR
jgi:hypothetical protein